MAKKTSKRKKPKDTPATGDVQKAATTATTVTEVTSRSECFYCNDTKPVGYVECDPEWELPGHPDHIGRTVCRDCVPAVDGRYDCCVTVQLMMQKSMKSKEIQSSDIDAALEIVWRSLNVDLDYAAFYKLARQLKVSHPWLRENKSK